MSLHGRFLDIDRTKTSPELTPDAILACAQASPELRSHVREKTQMRIVVLAALLIALPAFADDLTIEGVTYHDVRWGTVTPSDVSIIHSTGVLTMPLEKLPPDLQKRFGYDPKKAKEYTDAREERAAFIRETTGKIILLGKLVPLSSASKQAVKGWVTEKGPLPDESGNGADQGTVIDIGNTSRTPNRRIDSGPVEFTGVNSRPVILPGREITEPGGQEVLILGWVSPANIGERTEVEAYLVESRLGLKTFAMPQPVTLEWWKQHRQPK